MGMTRTHPMADHRTLTSPTHGTRMTRIAHSAVARSLAAIAVLAALSCSDATAPDASNTRDATDLRLLAVPYGAPPLVTTTASFYAVKGRSAAADIWYHAAAGHADSTKFLEFRMSAGSLDLRPDGTAFADGDSVLITLTVTDPRHFMIEFQPSGLRFAASAQPTLKLSWAACGDDLNYDGKVDAADTTIAQQLDIWRQEAPFQPWYRLTSVVVQQSKEINAQLSGFTGYALMY
jgi:hypothetical protein